MLYIRYKYIVVLILLKLYENTKTRRFTSFVYICNAIGNPAILKGEFGIPLTCLTPPHVLACSNPDLNFQCHMSRSFLVFSEVRWEVAIGFVDIGGIVNHHC